VNFCRQLHRGVEGALLESVHDDLFDLQALLVLALPLVGLDQSSPDHLAQPDVLAVLVEDGRVSEAELVADLLQSALGYARLLLPLEGLEYLVHGPDVVLGYGGADLAVLPLLLLPLLAALLLASAITIVSLVLLLHLAAIPFS
jgi:hypothetical protein